MNTEVSIRDYRPEDKPVVLGLFRLNTPQYFSPEEEQDLTHYLDQEIDHYYVLEYGGTVVGCGGINRVDEGVTGRISWDILHPDYQGKGLGSILLRHRVQQLKEMPEVKSITVRTSQLVYRFYEKNGFELVEVLKDYWAPGYDLYRMVYAR
ncbi:MAG TPA: GNAT family N-acetyltransferase [Chitinophagaceae bacterium]